MTHVADLIRYCLRNAIEVSAAFLKTEFVSETQAEALKRRLGGINIWDYQQDEELSEIAEAARCDLIHAHSFLTFKAALAASQRLQIPLVVTLHSVYLWAAFYWDVLAKAERIIAVGPAQARYLGPWAEKAVIIPNGIDTAVFRPGPESFGSNPGREIRVLWYGRVNGRLGRGLQVLDAAAPNLPSHICLAALGEADVQIKNITLQGWVDDPVPALQESHITFAHGRSLREAMACGSVGMLIGHGYGGMVTRAKLAELNYAVDAFPQYRLPRPNPADLVRDILQIANSGKLLALRKESRQIAEENFSLELMGSRTVEVYAAALA
jgi:glycosyltransferase involved in cell wall biosynthesis